MPTAFSDNKNRKNFYWNLKGFQQLIKRYFLFFFTGRESKLAVFYLINPKKKYTAKTSTYAHDDNISTSSDILVIVHRTPRNYHNDNIVRSLAFITTNTYVLTTCCRCRHCCSTRRASLYPRARVAFKILTDLH